MRRKLVVAALCALALAAGCTPLGVVGDVAVGTAQVAVGAVDLVL